MNTTTMQVDVVIPNQTKYLDLIGCIGERIAHELDGYTGDREALAYQLNLVLTEATVNAIKHAHDDSQHSVKISIQLEENALIMKVCDRGQGFDLEKVALPDFEHPEENGMGLFFIRSMMDSVTYTRQDDWNVLQIVKYLK